MPRKAKACSSCGAVDACLCSSSSKRSLLRPESSQNQDSEEQTSPRVLRKRKRSEATSIEKVIIKEEIPDPDAAPVPNLEPCQEVNVGQVKCEFCSLEFEDSPGWQNHMMVHHGYSILFEPFFTCICGFKSNLAKNMLTHINWNNPNQSCPALKKMLSPASNSKMKCPLCTSVRSTSNLNEHVVNRHMQFFNCYLCGFFTSQDSFMRLHVLAHNEPSAVYSSKNCDFKSLLPEQVEQHQKNHHNKFMCHTCDLTFSDDCEWGKHRLVHEQSLYVRSDNSFYTKNLTCEICYTKFDSENLLTLHKKQTNPVAAPEMSSSVNVELPAPAQPLIQGVYIKVEPGLEEEEAEASYMFIEESLQLDCSLEESSADKNGAKATPSTTANKLQPARSSDSFSFTELKPECDYEIFGTMLKCCHCLAMVANEEERKLHVLAHTTTCCDECTFNAGAVVLCSEHAARDQNELPTQTHRMVLGRLRRKNKFTYMYNCLDCYLVTNEEKDSKVISKYTFCELCNFSSDNKTSMNLHAQKHNTNPSLEFSCFLCPEGPFASLDAFEQHMDEPHSLESVRNQIKLFETPNATPIWCCKFCPFKGRSGILSHMKNHPKIKCTLCQTFLKVENVTQHLKREKLKNYIYYFIMSGCVGKSDKELYECKCCEQTFKYKADVEQHVLYEHKHLCKLCNQNFLHKEALMEHVRSHPNIPEEYKCRECYFVSFNPEAMSEHRANHDKIWNQSKKFVCSVCDLNTASIRELMRHRFTVHMKNGAFHCHLCRVDVKNLRNLRTHFSKRHRGVEGESIGCDCTHCHFIAKGVMKTVLFKHFWTCHYCGATFLTEDLQKRHCKMEHKSNYYCIICDRVFRDKAEYAHHSRSNLHIKNVKKAEEKQEDAEDAQKSEDNSLEDDEHS